LRLETSEKKQSILTEQVENNIRQIKQEYERKEQEQENENQIIIQQLKENLIQLMNEKLALEKLVETIGVDPISKQKISLLAFNSQLDTFQKVMRKLKSEAEERKVELTNIQSEIIQTTTGFIEASDNHTNANKNFDSNMD